MLFSEKLNDFEKKHPCRSITVDGARFRYVLSGEEHEKTLVLLNGGMDENTKTALVQVLSNDPRPQYHDDPERVYGFGFAGFEVKFKVCADTLTVTDIHKEMA